ncbi:MAG: hypothetical protein AB7I50_02380 [Vicinamibacterales bacterium]
MQPVMASAVLATALLTFLSATPLSSARAGATITMQTSDQLESATARFAPVDLAVNLDGLPPSERAALTSLVRAARLIDALFLRQVWAGNDALLLQLAGDPSPLGRERLHAFRVNKGPWSRLDHDEPFVPGVGRKPEQANFYPADATKDQVEAWFKTLDAAARARATGFFTVIRRDARGGLAAVPYSLHYQDSLTEIAAHLRQAANQTAQPTLQRFLRARADAFSSNDYYDSDVAWMQLDASIEPTIGPYEVYEDNWFNYKAAFEAFITIRDAAETARLQDYARHLQALEDALPIAPAYRNPKLGSLAPIRVVNVVFASGDGNRGVQTAAFNLPNDERIVQQQGTKRVMLKNVQEAKFRMVLEPIARVALAADDGRRIGFDAFFTHILMHELMHGLGPQTVSQAGTTLPIRQALKETYSTLEEAKADISGLWALQRLIDAGHVDRTLEDRLYVTFLASAFRSIRFGINEAHGRGIAIQLNRFLDAGAVVANRDGTFGVRPDRMKQVVADLTTEIMTIQAEGRYDDARSLMQRFAVVRPDVQRLLDRLQAVPVDIEPRYVTAEELEGY